jgi:hypothetical protein
MARRTLYRLGFASICSLNRTLPVQSALHQVRTSEAGKGFTRKQDEKEINKKTRQVCAPAGSSKEKTIKSQS